MRRCLISLVLGSCLLANPAAASIAGPTSAREFGRLHVRELVVLSDGRYVAAGSVVAPDSGAVRLVVYDTLRGTRRTRRNCYLFGSAPGRFLVACRGNEGFLLPRANRIVPIRGAGPYDSFYAMGRNWLVGPTGPPTDDPKAYPYWAWVNWRTGERIECGSFGDPDCDKSSYDLDAPGRAWADERRVETEPPYSLWLRGEYGDATRPLVLRRTGGSSAVMQRRLVCPLASACTPTLNSRVVTWVDAAPLRTRSRVRAYSIRHQKRIAWRVSRPGRQGWVRAVHTRYGVVIATCRAKTETCRWEAAPWRLSFARWPRGF